MTSISASNSKEFGGEFTLDGRIIVAKKLAFVFNGNAF